MDASERIDGYIAGFEDWRGEKLRRLRELIREAGPGLTEEWKWNSPVWSENGLVVSISGFKSHVSVNFIQGASLPDPKSVFNSGLDAKTMRTVKLERDDFVDESDFKDMVRTAIEHNAAKVRG